MDDFARFFDHALDLLAIAGANGCFRRVNHAWERTLGWTADELTSRSWLEFVHPDDEQATMEAGSRLFDGTSIISFENRYRCKDGTYRWLQWHAEPVGVEAYCTARDVTEARALKAAREQSYVENMAEALPQIVWTATPDGALDYYNRRWFDYTGMTLEQTYGWGWKPVLHPDDLQNCVDRWTESYQTGKPYEVEYRFKRASDGAYRWHLGRALPVRDEYGRIVRWFGTCTDIDDQRRAQDALRESQQQLESRVRARTSELAASNERFRAVAETAHDAIITADRDGLIIGWNGGAERLFGWKEQEVHGRTMTVLMPERFRAAHLAGLAEFKSTGHSRLAGKVLQLQALHRDGSEFPCELTLSAWMSGDGLFVTGILRDTSDRQRAEEQLRRMAAIVEGCDDAIYSHNLEGRIVSWNGGAERLYGYSADEIIGQHFHRLVPEDKRAEAEASFSRALGGSPLDHHETTRCCKDGTLVEVFLTASAFRDLSGRTSGMSLIARNITEKKSIERAAARGPHGFGRHARRGHRA